MDLLNTSEVARMVTVPVGTVRYWRSIGAGPVSFKLGPKAVRYRRDAVEAWIAKQESASQLGETA